MAGIKSIGILTSGGDAPGMNAAIRAVTRSAIYNGFTVKGIMRGFKGLVFNEIVEFKSQSVSNIIQLGGTILKTARSQEFTTAEGRKAAYDNMVAAGIVDPVKVTRSALANAASIASMFLTTECVLAEKKSDAPAMPAMPAGGMGGMM